MSIKILKAEELPDHSKKVYAEIKTGLLKKEAWVFVQNSGDKRWYPRRYDDELRYTQRELNPKFTREFLKIVPDIDFSSPLK